MQDRVMVFIDLRNMTKSVKMDSQFSRLDFEFLVNYLLMGRKLLAAYIFDSKGVLEADDRSRAFHDLLRYKGFRVIARDSFDVERDEQKEVDVAMACQIVVHALRDNYDTAIVVSGDRDFIPAIQFVNVKESLEFQTGGIIPLQIALLSVQPGGLGAAGHLGTDDLQGQRCPVRIAGGQDKGQKQGDSFHLLS